MGTRIREEIGSESVVCVDKTKLTLLSLLIIILILSLISSFLPIEDFGFIRKHIVI